MNVVLDVIGGMLDVLYNNGVFVCFGVVEDLFVVVFRDIFEINVFGMYDLICEVIKIMCK